MRDRVMDGRDLMENDGHASFERQLAYQIKYGNRPFSPQGIADTVDAAAMSAVYVMFAPAPSYQILQRTGEDTV
jgi:hypothetical protein